MSKPLCKNCIHCIKKTEVVEIVSGHMNNNSSVTQSGNVPYLKRLPGKTYYMCNLNGFQVLIDPRNANGGITVCDDYEKRRPKHIINWEKRLEKERGTRRKSH